MKVPSRHSQASKVTFCYVSNNRQCNAIACLSLSLSRWKKVSHKSVNGELDRFTFVYIVDRQEI